MKVPETMRKSTLADATSKSSALSGDPVPPGHCLINSLQMGNHTCTTSLWDSFFGTVVARLSGPWSNESPLSLNSPVSAPEI
ncbi:uncharacterized [Tachysurus ichikawai]